jgi:hypothetical protein
MADSKEFLIKIATEATGSGGEKVAADLEKIKVNALAAAPAVEALADAEAKLGASGSGDILGALGSGPSDALERQNSLLQQRRAIITATTEVMRLQAEGLTEEAASQAKILAVMQEAYALQTKGLLAEQVAVGIAEDRAEAESKIAAQRRIELETAQAQEDLNTILIAQEAERAALAEKAAAAEAKATKAKAAQEAEQAAAFALQEAGQAADFARKEKAVLRDAGRGAGLGRNTGMLAAFGPEALIGGIAISGVIEGVIALYKAFGKAAEEAAKKVKEANEEAAKSTKEMTEAARKGWKEATAEAEAYVTALKGQNEVHAAFDKRQKEDDDLDLRKKIADRKEKEIGDLAKATDPTARARVTADYDKDIAQYRSDAENQSAIHEKQSALDRRNSALDMQANANAELPGAEADAKRKRERAQGSDGLVEKANREKIEAENRRAKIPPVISGEDDPAGAAAAAKADAEVNSASAQEKAARETSEKDTKEANDAESKVSALKKTIQDLGETAAKAQPEIEHLTKQQGVVAQETALKLSQEQSDADKRIHDAEQKAREAAEKAKELLAEGKRGGAALDHPDHPANLAGAVERGAEKGVAAGLAKHDSHASHPSHSGSHTHPKDGLSPGPAGDGLRPGHGGDGLSDHGGLGHTNFEDEFHKHLPGASGLDSFRRAFDPKNQHPIDTRTDKERIGQQTHDNRLTSPIIDEANKVMGSESGAPKSDSPEHIQQLNATIKQLITFIKELRATNKNGSNDKELAATVQELQRDVDEVKSQFANSR